MLSHNSLYAYAAEEGGLSAVESHYQSEKYSILIESTTSLKQLMNLHQEFFIYYVTRNSKQTYREGKELSSKINKIIEQNFMSDVTIKQIADELFMSESYMMRNYKKETGVTIHDKVQEVRISEAKQLLDKSDLSISDISYRVGFNSSQYFSRAFKRIMNQTPFDYRKQKRQESANF